MNWREKIADWLTGGALTDARSAWGDWKDQSIAMEARADDARAHLEAILYATADGKSGTARKINRMAREALE